MLLTPKGLAEHFSASKIKTLREPNPSGAAGAAGVLSCSPLAKSAGFATMLPPLTGRLCVEG